ESRTGSGFRLTGNTCRMGAPSLSGRDVRACPPACRAGRERAVPPGGDRGLLHRLAMQGGAIDLLSIVCPARDLTWIRRADPVPVLRGPGIGSWYRFASWRSPISPGDRIDP